MALQGERLSASHLFLVVLERFFGEAHFRLREEAAALLYLGHRQELLEREHLVLAQRHCRVGSTQEIRHLK